MVECASHQRVAAATEPFLDLSTVLHRFPGAGGGGEGGGGSTSGHELHQNARAGQFADDLLERLLVRGLPGELGLW